MFSQFKRSMTYFLAVIKIDALTFFTYRGQAILWLLYSLMSVIISFITITVIYNVSSGIAGWSYYQMLMLTGTANMALAVILFFNDADITSLLRTGKIDLMLTKPYSRLVVFLTSSNDITQIARMLSSLVLIIYACQFFSISASGIILYAILFCAGTIAGEFFVLMLIMLAYSTIRSGRFVNRMLSLFSTASNYPLNVYGFFGQVAFTVLLPIGLAYYYPANALLSGTISWVFLLIMALAVTITVVSYQIFNRLTKEYVSGGG